MESIVISGGRRLRGEIDLQGSKNSSLPILAATVLVRGVSVIHNCPDIRDVDAAVKILRHLGCLVKRENDTLIVDSTEISCYNIPETFMREMRSSIVFLGSVLGRMGIVQLSSPGGCEIGLRPIDLHLSSLRSLGYTIDEAHGSILCRRVGDISGSVISLSFPSVGATENAILASVISKGRTVILNAAREPEIKDLADFLCSCGCRVEIGSQGTVAVEGVDSLHGCEHRVIPDRIAALTYMAATAAAGGEVLIRNVDTSAFLSVLPLFEGAGCEIKDKGNSLLITMKRRPIAVRDIRTMPYPGFPTDAQAPVMTMCAVAEGTSVIVENIFESRFKHVGELIRMGAEIKIEGRLALIDGVKELYAARVQAQDLRGGAALVIAGLCAVGETRVENVRHIDRGYERIDSVLQSLGAEIRRINDE
ncbi:MAG: UDP-N-acetylglucosamine 1-carboxyvinyltransferase [Acutalibacteraceae bacterium]